MLTTTPNRPAAPGFHTFRPHFADCDMRGPQPRTTTPKPLPNALF